MQPGWLHKIPLRRRDPATTMAKTSRQEKGRWSSKLAMLGAGAGVGMLALGVGGGAWSIFQSSTPATSQSLSSGTVLIALAGSGSSSSLSVGASDLVAGDVVAREAVLKNTGTSGIGTITLSMAGPASPNALTTDTTNGLQAEVQSCTGGTWTSTTLADGGYSYSCSGTVDTLLASAPVSSFASGVVVPGSAGTLAPNATLPVVITLTLPTSASNSLEGLSTSVTYNFVATQASAGPA